MLRSGDVNRKMGDDGVGEEIFEKKNGRRRRHITNSLSPNLPDNTNFLSFSRGLYSMRS